MINYDHIEWLYKLCCHFYEHHDDCNMFIVQAVLVIYNCISDEEESFLTWLQFELQKLAKSEEENFAGNYFKPHRASKLMEQAKQVQKCKKISSTQSGNTEWTHLISRYRRWVCEDRNPMFLMHYFVYWFNFSTG